MRADRTPVSGPWPALRSGGRLFTLMCHWGERWSLILDFEPCTEKHLNWIKTTHSPAKGEYLNPKNPNLIFEPSDLTATLGILGFKYSPFAGD